jgi:hypothetical protein
MCLLPGLGKKTGITENVHNGLDITVTDIAIGPDNKTDMSRPISPFIAMGPGSDIPINRYVHTDIPGYNMDIPVMGISVPICPDRFPHFYSYKNGHIGLAISVQIYP